MLAGGLECCAWGRDYGAVVGGCEGSAVRVGRHMQWWSRVVQGAHVLGMCRARKRVNGTGGGVGVCGRNGGKSLAGRKSFGGFRRGEVDCLRQG